MSQSLSPQHLTATVNEAAGTWRQAVLASHRIWQPCVLNMLRPRVVQALAECMAIAIVRQSKSKEDLAKICPQELESPASKELEDLAKINTKVVAEVDDERRKLLDKMVEKAVCAAEIGRTLDDASREVIRNGIKVMAASTREFSMSFYRSSKRHRKSAFQQQ
eukprot:TRINITY_DN110718_c0_g1_i1.p1 TRINITY_DN110718_c0_g1~~TRINITY_DN110718_c0_g1_i1.p1  ORF type:complete len:163 (+),score=26.05 TRINITY_DN110718_c0_g1_i1:290-778(+)